MVCFGVCMAIAGAAGVGVGCGGIGVLSTLGTVRTKSSGCGGGTLNVSGWSPLVVTTCCWVEAGAGADWSSCGKEPCLRCARASAGVDSSARALRVAFCAVLFGARLTRALGRSVGGFSLDCASSGFGSAVLAMGGGGGAGACDPDVTMLALISSVCACRSENGRVRPGKPRPGRPSRSVKSNICSSSETAMPVEMRTRKRSKNLRIRTEMRFLMH